MKESINRILYAGALFLAFFALPLANAQNPPQPTAQSPVNNSTRAPTLPPDIDPNSPLGQIVRMLQSNVPENAVLACIAKSRAAFSFSAADVTYLNDLGAPSGIRAAMVQRNQELGASAGAQSSQLVSGQSQEPQDVTEDYFYGALSPYGTWIQMPGYGLCWQPCAASYDAHWTPYCTLGQWIYTDYGWYWLSGYSWGWCVFHYGRWFYDSQRGWCWWPSTTWGPSWVFWRYSGNYCGWAPLPPHFYYSQENGLVYNGASIDSSYDFGFGANFFSFVPKANLCDANTERFRLPSAQAAKIFAQSEVIDDINSDNRVIVNSGISVNRIAGFDSGNMRSFKIRPVESVAVPGARGEQILPDGETLAINRPYFNVNVPSALKQGVWPIAAQQQPVAHQPPSIIVYESPRTYPSDDDQDNSVIYVDSAAQNGPPVPTVTTAGPQDYAAPAPSPVVSGESYWSVSAEAPGPVDTAAVYMSPRLKSHENSRHKVPQTANHREFNPSAGGSPPALHQEGRTAGPELIPTQHSQSGPSEAPSHSHSSGPGEHGDDGSGSHSSGPNHGH